MPPLIVVENIAVRKLSMYTNVTEKKRGRNWKDWSEKQTKNPNHQKITSSSTSFNILGACVVSECFLGLETFDLHSDWLLHLNGGHVPFASGAEMTGRSEELKWHEMYLTAAKCWKDEWILSIAWNFCWTYMPFCNMCRQHICHWSKLNNPQYSTVYLFLCPYCR